MLTDLAFTGWRWAPRTWHRYRYAFASPISYRDPYGLQGEGPEPAGAYPSECASQGIPLWMRILSAPYRLFPGDFCLPGNLGCWGGAKYADWLENEYYPSLGWRLYWTWYHPAQAWGLPKESLKTLMIEDWFFELGEPKRTFYADHPATRLLMHHKGVEYYRQRFYQSGYQETGGRWDAGEGTTGFKRLSIEIGSHLRIAYETLFRVEDTSETIRGTLGTYWVSIKRVGNEAEFKVENLTGRESFLRTPWGPLLTNLKREQTDPTWFSEHGWGGNLYQTFIWREPLPQNSP